jgi:hypothetical protein
LFRAAGAVTPSHRTTQAPFTHATLCDGETAGGEPRHVPAVTEPVAAAFAELPGDIVGNTFVVDGTDGASKDKGRMGSVVVVGALFWSAVSPPRSAHKPFRQIMPLAGCTVTQPFARSNRAAPAAEGAGACQNPLTHVELASGAGDEQAT